MDIYKKFPQKIIQTPLGTMSQGEFLEKIHWEDRKKDFFRRTWRTNPELPIREVLQKRQLELYGFVNPNAIEEDMRSPDDEFPYFSTTPPGTNDDDTALFPLGKGNEDEETPEIYEDYEEENVPERDPVAERKRIQNLLFGISDTTQVGISQDNIHQIRTTPEKDTLKLSLPNHNSKTEKPSTVEETVSQEIKGNDDIKDLKSLINKVYEQSNEQNLKSNDLLELKSLIDKVYESEEPKKANPQEDLKTLKQIREGKQSDLYDLKAMIDEMYGVEESLPEEEEPQDYQAPPLALPEINYSDSKENIDLDEMFGSSDYNMPLPYLQESEEETDVLKKTDKIHVPETKKQPKIKVDLQLSLFKTVMRNNDLEMRSKAVSQITDSRFLDRILQHIKIEEIKILALKNLKHPGLIVDYILDIETYGLTTDLLKHVQDTRMLFELACNVDLNIRQQASQKLSDNSLKQKAKNLLCYPCDACKVVIDISIKDIGNHVSCPNCEHKFRVPKRVKCQLCGKKLFDTMIFCDCGGNLE